MSRKPIGDRPMTMAERQAHQRAKRRAERDLVVEALLSITHADYVTEAREIAAQALHFLRPDKKVRVT